MSDDGGTQRAIGRLEGRVSVVETQLTNLDTRVTRQLDAVASKVSLLGKAIGELKTVVEGFTGRVKGSWDTIAILAACVVGLASLIASALNLAQHWGK